MQTREAKFFAKLSAKESGITFFPQKLSPSASSPPLPKGEAWGTHKPREAGFFATFYKRKRREQALALRYSCSVCRNNIKRQKPREAGFFATFYKRKRREQALALRYSCSVCRNNIKRQKPREARFFATFFLKESRAEFKSAHLISNCYITFTLYTPSSAVAFATASSRRSSVSTIVYATLPLDFVIKSPLKRDVIFEKRPSTFA